MKKVLPGVRSATTCPTSVYKVSSDTDADCEDVNEEVVKSATNGTRLALTKKMTSSTKVQNRSESVKLTGREQWDALKATNAWTTTNFGQIHQKTKEDALFAV